MSFWDKMTEPRPLNTNFGKEPKVKKDRCELEVINKQLRDENERLKEMLKLHMKNVVSMDDIMRFVEEYTGMDKNEILSKSQTRPHVRARAIFIFIAYKNLYNYSQIGKYIQRDRTSVMAARFYWDKWLNEDEVEIIKNLTFSE